MIRAAPKTTKKATAPAKRAKAPAKATAAKKAPAKPAVKAKKAVAKATVMKKALSKAAAKTKKVPAGALGLPHVEVTLQGQRYIVGEYGSLMTFDDYEKLMANKQ